MILDLALKIQQTQLYLPTEREIDIFFPPVRLDSTQLSCLELNFTAFAFFEVKLAYASKANNTHKERILFRTVESLGKEFQIWTATLSPNMTEGQEFVVVLHAKRSSIGLMAVIKSIKLRMTACPPTGKKH